MKRALAAFVVALAACSSGGVKNTLENTVDRVDPIAVARVRVDRGALHRDGEVLRFAPSPSAWHPLSPKLDVSLPVRSDGAMHVALADDADAWIELAPFVARVSREAQVVRAGAIYRDVDVDTDALIVAGVDRVEELRVLRSTSAPATTAWSLRLGPHVARARVQRGVVEITGKNGQIVMTTEPAFARDAKGRQRDVELTLRDDVLFAHVDVDGLDFPVVVDPTWSSTSDMGTYWNGHAILSAKGSDTVLLMGGVHTTTTPTGAINEAATSNAWTWSIAGGSFKPILPMSQVRDAFPVVQIGNNFLVIGGDNYGGLGDTANCEVYDPIHTDWHSVAPMSIARRDMNAVVLLDGRVLVAGGLSHDVPTAKAEIYDPKGNTWSPAGALRKPTNGPNLVVLDDGRVMAAGGNDYGHPQRSFSTVDFYDPSTNAWSAGPDMAEQRDGFGLVKLPSGNVIAFGGASASARSATSEIFDVASSTWSAGPQLPEAWESFALVTLTDGNVLIAGGHDDEYSWASVNATVLDVNAVSFAKASPMSTGRLGAYIAAVKDSALLAGGLTNPHGTTATAEVFTPLSNGDACTLDGDCRSLHCVDGVCCDKGCTDACSACDVAGHSGTCTAVLGPPHGARACSDPSLTCTESGCSNGEPPPAPSATADTSSDHAQTLYSCAISHEENRGLGGTWVALLALVARARRRRSSASRYAR